LSQFEITEITGDKIILDLNVSLEVLAKTHAEAYMNIVPGNKYIISSRKGIAKIFLMKDTCNHVFGRIIIKQLINNDY